MEITQTMNALRSMNLGPVEIMPLHAQLSSQEQKRVFLPTSNRKIVVATNIAETSITIEYVPLAAPPPNCRRMLTATCLLPTQRHHDRHRLGQGQGDPVRGREGDAAPGRGPHQVSPATLRSPAPDKADRWVCLARPVGLRLVRGRVEPGEPSLENATRCSPVGWRTTRCCPSRVSLNVDMILS